MRRNETSFQSGYSAVAVHPGLLHTELACFWMENNFPKFMRPVAKLVLREWGLHAWWTLPAVYGADAVFFAATAPVKQVSYSLLALNAFTIEDGCKILFSCPHIGLLLAAASASCDMEISSSSLLVTDTIAC